MWVDWEHKALQFQHAGEWILLTGVQPKVTAVPQVSAQQLMEWEDQNDIAHVVVLCSVSSATQDAQELPEIAALLEEFQVVFAEPKTLPQHRSWDHRIPLLPGAKPVNIRPYRYTPEQKNEIEAQIKEMLQQVLIIPSVSPFSSPVLLVKKKDQTWRFCVDFRHLNAITMKGNCSLPIIDELLDELAGSKWFSKLDLREGYHQIRLVEEDEEKTTFRTHVGHFQFRVMPYGLTFAPNTFQTAVTIVLGSLMRKGVLAFMDDILVHTATYQEHL